MDSQVIELATPLSTSIVSCHDRRMHIGVYAQAFFNDAERYTISNF